MRGAPAPSGDLPAIPTSTVHPAQSEITHTVTRWGATAKPLSALCALDPDATRNRPSSSTDYLRLSADLLLSH
jgi:hypothetical protein